ncbi:MAG: GntR family transcriptional regulator [Oscillospiraceae bacterium]|jgi:GntR family transcriptional regulator
MVILRGEKMARPKKTQHQELRDIMLNMIDSDQYEIGDKLMPELELCKQLEVGRTALRHILDELQNEGYIQRIQGSGTIILKKRTKYALNLSNLGSAAELISGYEVLNTEYFKITEIEAGSKYAERLMVEPDERLLHVERVRSLDGTPAIYTHNVLVKNRIGYHENLYAEIANSLSDTMGWHVETCDASLRLCTADEFLSEMLRTSPGTSLLLVEEIARQPDGMPLDYCHDYYVADLFDFQITRTRKQ